MRYQEKFKNIKQFTDYKKSDRIKSNYILKT